MEERYLEEYRQRARKAAEAPMSVLCERAGLVSGGSWTLLVHWSAAELILAQEDEQDCDLIVIGRQAQRRVEDILLGSVSRRILAESGADVLVLP